jgi:transcriptional regulator with XRE-family HTH domain
MAEKVRVSPRHFQDIESQRREGIRLATIDRIAKALGVESWELLRPGRFPAPDRLRGRSARPVNR